MGQGLTFLILTTKISNFLSHDSTLFLLQLSVLALLQVFWQSFKQTKKNCLLYTSDAADDMQCVDLGGRRIIKKIFFKQKTAYEM